MATEESHSTGAGEPESRAHFTADTAPGDSSSSHSPMIQSASTNGPTRRKTRTSTRNEQEVQSSTSQPRRSFSLRRVRTSLLVPERPLMKSPSQWQSVVAVFKASWLNLLLVFIPVSWAMHFAFEGEKDTLIFVFSFLAIIPLAKLLAFATDELSMRVGQTLAGLLNATLGNAVELIVAIIALVQCELQVVQSSLIGSILSNLLLVLGMCFFAGGVKYQEQGFGISATQLNSSLLTLAVIAVLLPQAFHLTVTNDSDEGQDILNMSHGVAIILLFIYCSYLFFQLYSHAVLYDDKSEQDFKSTKYAVREKKDQDKEKPGNALQLCQSPQQINGTDLERGDSATTNPKEEVDEGEQPQLTLLVTIILLVVDTVFVAVTAEFLVSAIDGMTNQGVISKEFVGVILLPIVGNAAEHVTAVAVSVKDKLNLSLGVAVGSSIQIALFVIPFIVTLAWILGKPLTLLFDPYESIALFLSVLTVNYVVQDGKSNWLEGMILMCLYVILGVTFWFYPGSDPSGLFDTCS